MGEPERLPDEEDRKEETKKQENLDTKTDRFGNYDKQGLSTFERKKMDDGASARKVVEERRNLKEQAENLLAIAEKDEKITKDEARKLRRELNINPGARQKVLEDIQEKIASVGATSEDKDAELPAQNPNLLKAYSTYDKLIDSHTRELGKKQVKEYKKWIREQKPSLKNLEELTSKFFQSELPPRQEAFNHLKRLFGKQGLSDPMAIDYLAEEGLSERKAFAENIEKLEKFFESQGGLKDKLYSNSSEKTLMREICQSKDTNEQEHILQRTRFIEKAESQGYATLERAVQSETISQKSMNNMLDHYKKIAKWGDRLENIKLWDSFVENERKLTDELKDVYEMNPPNKEGFKLAFTTFKDLDYVGKEKFITEEKANRTKEISLEKENKNLTVKAFKHKCERAREDNIISKSTQENYSKWIDNHAKNATYEEVKQFYEILTSPTPIENAKNLKAYEERRKKYKEELKQLQDLSPDLDKEKIKKWQDDYDKLGWKDREKQFEKLRPEIKKAKDKRSGIKEVTNITAKSEIQESIEKNPALKNKETAIKAIKLFEERGFLGDALILANELRINNSKDKEVEALYMSLLDKVNGQGLGGKETLKEQDIYSQFSKVADLIIQGDQVFNEEAKRLQTQDTALRLMEENVRKHHGIKKAADRNKAEITEKTRGDNEVQEVTREYIEESDENKVIDEQSLKGKDAIVIDLKSEKTRLEETTLRRRVQNEQGRNKENHGGSTMIEFRRRKGEEQRLDPREARALHEQDESILAQEMVAKMVEITHPGQTPSPDILSIAHNAALARIRQKEKEKIEQMSSEAA